MAIIHHLRISLLALLLSPMLAHGAITFVSSNTDRSASATTSTPTDPASTTTDDVYIAVSTINSVDGSWTIPSGWTQIDDLAVTPGSELHWNIAYIKRGASAPNLTWSYSGTADDIRVSILAFRGVDTTTQLDVTWVQGSHYQRCTDDPTCANPAITTNTNGAMVVLFHQTYFSAAGTPGAPSGYTLEAFVDDNNPQHNFAYKEVATAGTETPGVWTHTSYNAGEDPVELTIALKPAGSSSSLLLRRRR